MQLSDAGSSGRTHTHMSAQTRTVLFYSLTVQVALGAGLWTTARHLDTRGREFFETGKEVVETLDRLVAAAKKGDTNTLFGAFSADYSGHELGLRTPHAVSMIDGIETLRFYGGAGP